MGRSSCVHRDRRYVQTESLLSFAVYLTQLKKKVSSLSQQLPRLRITTSAQSATLVTMILEFR